MATKLRFYAGLRSIGGTVVSVEHGNSRVVFDFGTTYNPEANVLDGQVKVRPLAITRDYIKLNMLPKIDGIYSETCIRHIKDLQPAGYDGKETVVFISHLHLDHIGGMGLIDSSISVYMTDDAHDLYKCLHTIGEGVPGNRSFQTCSFGKSVQIGDIIVKPIRLDHDTLGACAFHIQTPDGNIVYSGDLRLHGKHPEWTEEFIAKSVETKTDVLIMEGTTLRSEKELHRDDIVPVRETPNNLLSERRLHAKVAKTLLRTKGLCFFNLYHRNLDRIEEMMKAAQMGKRKAVLEIETAYIVNELTSINKFFIYESEQLRFEKESGTLPQWKKKLMELYKTVSFQEVNEKPDSFFVQNSYHNLLELMDLNLAQSVYIHSNGVPLGEFDPSYRRLTNLLNHLGIDYEMIGTSGHAVPQHLKYIVDEIDPTTLIPLHSFYPERLMPKNGIQLLPEYGMTYTLEKGTIR